MIMKNAEAMPVVMRVGARACMTSDIVGLVGWVEGGIEYSISE